MSLFAYEALDARGRRVRGEIEADSERAARQRLKARRLVVRKLTVLTQQGDAGGGKGMRRLTTAETVLFLQQLATLTEAGMPLSEALSAIADGMGNARARRTIAAIRQAVIEGGSLAESLRRQGMDELVCNMIAAGEETGQLEAVAARLAVLLEHRQQLRQDLLSTTLYPLIVLGFGVLVMLFLMTVVVPQVVSVFERAGGELPRMTRVVIALSDFLRDHGLESALALLGAALGYRLAMRLQGLRWKRDRLLLDLPGVGALLARIETARFARTLGMLLAGGVPMLAALHIANQNWSLQPLKKLGESARESVREGGALSDALRQGAYIPNMAIQLFRVGEQSGRLDRMLIRVADHYEREVARDLKRLLSIAEPLLVLLMALGVGAMALAILLPIAEMNELVR